MSTSHDTSRSLLSRLFGPAQPSRRRVLGAAGLGAAGVALGSLAADPQRASAAVPGRWVDRDDAPHARTWMSWPSRSSVWGGRRLAGVQEDIALIARTVARYEPVVLCAPDAYTAARARSLCGAGVTVLDSIPTDDLWMRDTAPVFRRDGRGGLDALGLGFNGWGGKQTHAYDADVARLVADDLRLRFSRTGFVGEGGAIETDGDGTLMATESSLVNKNRNRGMSRAEVEDAVLDAYGADKMIWVPGIKGKDITDDHIDVTSRFIRPGVVMVQVPPADRDDVWARDAREQFSVLSSATDARGRKLRVIRVEGPDTVRSRDSQFVDSYLNFHVVNGAVITAQFGDAVKDAAARRALAEAFPGRAVVQIDVDRLMAGGGGIHCSTMHEPLP
ncbi:agmatine deiminase family protein [Streptomyces vinaceus]|uniref:Agmatine deiminase family protein n=1 Tax=Streptomyces vinaceus TaxID=1960 RepID=A0A5J6JCU1_STRVI|nr:agmatine deiminase family protein [Streptomyces vinaceus]QEV48719.1 agmatine deiminase family protein [Streptomyces vinaceus]GHE36732.1 porphyromonas-type peptidyl-arginine deiminase [Streptomyces vinaceus]